MKCLASTEEELLLLNDREWKRPCSARIKIAAKRDETWLALLGILGLYFDEEHGP